MNKNSLTIRILLILGIIVLLLIPLVMIQSLINERQSYRDVATQEIYESWAGEQIVAGPILTIEKEYVHTDVHGKKRGALGEGRSLSPKYTSVRPDRHRPIDKTESHQFTHSRHSDSN